MTTNERDEAARRLDEATRRARLHWQDRELWRWRCQWGWIVAIIAIALNIALLVTR